MLHDHRERSCHKEAFAKLPCSASIHPFMYGRCIDCASIIRYVSGSLLLALTLVKVTKSPAWSVRSRDNTYCCSGIC